MSPASEARDRLVAALKTVPRLRVHADLGEVTDPPCAVVGPPRLAPDAYGPDLSTATFVIGLVARSDDRALDFLLENVQAVVSAIYEAEDAVVTAAEPGTWPTGSSSLPAYLIETEVTL